MSPVERAGADKAAGPRRPAMPGTGRLRGTRRLTGGPQQRRRAPRTRGDRAARENAARELEQLRADAERERDEILARLADTAGQFSEVTTAHAAELERVRADAARERAERDLDAARAELARLRQ